MNVEANGRICERRREGKEEIVAIRWVSQLMKGRKGEAYNRSDAVKQGKTTKGTLLFIRQDRLIGRQRLDLQMREKRAEEKRQGK